MPNSDFKGQSSRPDLKMENLLDLGNVAGASVELGEDDKEAGEDVLGGQLALQGFEALAKRAADQRDLTCRECAGSV